MLAESTIKPTALIRRVYLGEGAARSERIDRSIGEDNSRDPTATPGTLLRRRLRSPRRGTSGSPRRTASRGRSS